MRIQETMFVVIGIFMLIGTAQEEVRERWRRKKKSSGRSAE